MLQYQGQYSVTHSTVQYQAQKHCGDSEPPLTEHQQSTVPGTVKHQVQCSTFHRTVPVTVQYQAQEHFGPKFTDGAAPHHRPAGQAGLGDGGLAGTQYSAQHSTGARQYQAQHNTRHCGDSEPPLTVQLA